MTDPFMNRRPAPGNAFLCANDVAFLIHIYIRCDCPEDMSTTTNKRSRDILIDQGLITPNDLDAGALWCTALGDDLVSRILKLSLRATT